MPFRFRRSPIGYYRRRTKIAAIGIAYAICVGLIVLITACSQTFRVADYGAKGDGVTDDAEAIQAAIDAAAGVAGTVTFPAGTFVVGSSLELRTGITIAGTPSQTILTMSARPSQTYILQGTDLAKVTVSGITFRSAGYAVNVSGLYMVGAKECRASSLRFEGLSYGMKLGSGSIGSGWVVADIVARDCLNPLYASHIHDSSFAGLDLQAVKTSSDQDHAVYLERECRRLTFTDCTFSGGSGYTLQLWVSDGSSSDLTFADQTLDATAGRYPLVIGPSFSGIQFTSSELRAGPSGQVVQFYGGEDVTFDGFAASGGSVLVSVIGTTSNVVFRNGTYQGTTLGSGVTFEDVILVGGSAVTD